MAVYAASDNTSSRLPLRVGVGVLVECLVLRMLETVHHITQLILKTEASAG